jgi:glycine/D-amino acid oxidase-like deaminating enzyme
LPESVRREVSEDEMANMRELLRRFLPGADGPLKSSTVCLYTNTPDEHFLLDWHPHCPAVFIASPCSGHGFKFASVVGEIAAARLCDESVPFDLSLFRYARFARAL